MYQIDRTVDQWLGLSGDEALELERGEDIDLVGRLLSAGGGAGGESRLLEQVKHREGGITLRTRAALEALANFHDHRIQNSHVDLRFRFLTNAPPATEQFSPFPNRVPGVTYWEKVRTRQLEAVAVQTAAGHLRRFLAKSHRPGEFDESVWARWKAYVEAVTSEAFIEFIDRFEWSTSQPEAADFPVALRTRILSLGLAKGETEAQSIADRLFVHVARLLGTAGLKRLTVEDRSRLLVAPALSPADREFLAAVRAIVADHSDRLDQLEADVSALGARVEAIFLSTAAAERVDLAVPPPDLSVPLPVVRVSSRGPTVALLRALLGRSGWLALRGGPDVGKSQLAIQIAVAHGTCRGWVRFHHGDPPTEAVRLFDVALAALTKPMRSSPDGVAPAGAVLDLEPGSLIVLDDLPRLTADHPLAQRLVRLGLAARMAGAHVVSTSQYELPARVRHLLGDGWFHDRLSPPLTDDEARGLFQAHGAPEPVLTDRRVEFLNRQAAGHPLLLTATAEFLAGRAWRYRTEEIDALLRGDHREAILPEVIERLTRTLGDPPRELLYRLTLTLGSFDQADVTAVAGVAPPVDRPREHFGQLLGAWVQRDTATRFEVSPLVRPLGLSEVVPDVRSRCFRELAEVITRRREMNPLECERAIHYNLEAREPGRAITLYVVFLVEVIKSKPADFVTPFIDKWRQVPLPSDLTVGNRLFVRAYQLAAFTQYNLDSRFVVEDIDALLESATDADGWAVIALAVQSLAKFRTKDTGRAIRYVRRAIELPAVFGPGGREITFEGFSTPDLLWMLVTDLRTPALVSQWLDAAEAIPETQRDRFWGSQLGLQGVWLVGNKVYATEWEKPPANQNWRGVLGALAGLRDRAHRLRQPRLEAALTGVMLEILGDRKWLDEAAAVADVTLSRWPNDPDVQFEVRGTWGRQHAYQRRPDLALPLLDAALAQPHSPHDHERLRCLLAANICVEPGDLRYAEQARDLARASTQTADIEVARALGEYALSVLDSRGGQAGAIAAFPVWSEAMRRYLGIRRKDRFWRALFPFFAHATSYLCMTARDGRPPDYDHEGRAFAVPSRRSLMRDYSAELEGLYREDGVATVAWLMQAYAPAAGDGGEADFWMRLAIDEARRVGATYLQAATGIDAAAAILASGRIEDAVEVGVFAGRGMVVHREATAEDRANFAGTGVDVAAEFRKLPAQKRRLGDQFAVICGLLPAAIALVRSALTEPTLAASTARQVAGFCRDLADDGDADPELWRTAADLFELAAGGTNAMQIISRVRTIEGGSERETALRVMGYVLATWHAGTEEALAYQLSTIEALVRWYPAREGVHRLVLTPYIEAYWRNAAHHRRFAFRAPDLTIAAIESAASEPEPNRVHAVLSAAAGGFRIGGAHQVLQRLRGALGRTNTAS